MDDNGSGGQHHCYQRRGRYWGARVECHLLQRKSDCFGARWRDSPIGLYRNSRKRQPEYCRDFQCYPWKQRGSRRVAAERQLRQWLSIAELDRYYERCHVYALSHYQHTSGNCGLHRTGNQFYRCRFDQWQHIRLHGGCRERSRAKRSIQYRNDCSRRIQPANPARVYGDYPVQLYVYWRGYQQLDHQKRRQRHDSIHRQFRRQLESGCGIERIQYHDYCSCNGDDRVRLLR